MRSVTSGWLSLKRFSQHIKITLSHRGSGLSNKQHKPCCWLSLCQSAWPQTPQCIWTTAPLSVGRPVYYGERTPAEQCRFPFHFFLTLCSSSCSWIMAILFPDSWCHRLSHYSGHTNIWNEKEKKREEEEEGRKVPSPGSTGGLDLTDPLPCSVDLWFPESRATVTDCRRMTPRLLLCTPAHYTYDISSLPPSFKGWNMRAVEGATGLVFTSFSITQRSSFSRLSCTWFPFQGMFRQEPLHVSFKH